MGILMQQAIRDMNEAMTLEDLGAKINLMPEGATLRPDQSEDGVWVWFLPIYTKSVPLSIFFYVEKGMSLAFTMAMQGAAQHTITDDEEAVIEAAFDWLFTEGEFYVSEK